jgi:hypothetical protein
MTDPPVLLAHGFASMAATTDRRGFLEARQMAIAAGRLACSHHGKRLTFDRPLETRQDPA